MEAGGLRVYQDDITRRKEPDYRVCQVRMKARTNRWGPSPAGGAGPAYLVTTVADELDTVESAVVSFVIPRELTVHFVFSATHP